MGDIKLFEHRIRTQSGSFIWVVLYNHVSGWLDDLFNTEIKMVEGKTLLQILTVCFGVPAFIYAWFYDVQTWASAFDVWKGVVLTLIGAFTAAVIGLRQLVKLIHEYHELKKKINEKDEPDKTKTA